MSAFQRTLLAATLAVALLAVPAAALAAKPTTTAAKTTTTAKTATTAKGCWNALIRDWYDGRIDKTYPVHCYQDALKHLPRDVRTYSDAYDVISRALADATRGEKHPDPDEPVQPPGGSATSTGATTTTVAPGVDPGGPGGTASGGPIGGVLNGGDQGADGVPIPLLVLAGLALLLVAAGGAGLVARRIQARRAQP